MAILRIAVQAGLLIASGWLLNETVVPLWQIGLALIFAAAAVAWMYLREA